MECSSVSGHRLVEHTADVIVESWGDTLASCFAEAALGLIETYAEVPAPPARASVVLAIARTEAAGMLERLLDEIIFLLDTELRVPVDCGIEDLGQELSVTVGVADRGDVIPTGSVPKAVSRSGLVVEEIHGWRCRFIVDV